MRHLFEATVARCIADGLVSGQRFAADASLIEADANKQNSTPKEDWDASAINPEDAAEADKHRFLQASGFYDNAPYIPTTSVEDELAKALQSVTTDQLNPEGDDEAGSDEKIRVH